MITCSNILKWFDDSQMRSHCCTLYYNLNFIIHRISRIGSLKTQKLYSNYAISSRTKNSSKWHFLDLKKKLDSTSIRIFIKSYLQKAKVNEPLKYSVRMCVLSPNSVYVFSSFSSLSVFKNYFLSCLFKSFLYYFYFPFMWQFLQKFSLWCAMQQKRREFMQKVFSLIKYKKNKK